jgi:hypothetical protein
MLLLSKLAGKHVLSINRDPETKSISCFLIFQLELEKHVVGKTKVI